MKRLLLLALSAVSAFATGTVSQSITQLGSTGNYALSFYWVGDASTGTIPVTLAQLGAASQLAQGMRILEVETVPGSPNPTNNYSVQIVDSFGGDMMGGAVSSLSPTVTQFFSATSSTPPITGGFSLKLSGQAVGGAKGTVIVYFGPQSIINAVGGSPGPQGVAGPIGPAGPTGCVGLFTATYNFTPQAPGGSLTGGGGSQSITLSPVPLGINGTDTGHYVYISAGTGTAEAALITGGTAVSGAGSGTIVVSPANNHTGAWTVQSATAGMSEALWTFAPGSGNICVSPGVNAVYGPFITPSSTNVSVFGGGPGTIIQPNQTSGNVFQFGAGGNSNDFGLFNLSIVTPGAQTGLTAVAVSSNKTFRMQNVEIRGPQFGVNDQALITNAVYYDHVLYLPPCPASSIAFQFNGGGNISLTDSITSCGGNTNLAAGLILQPTGGTVMGGVFVHANDFYHAQTCVELIPGTNSAITQIEMSDNFENACQTLGVLAQPTGNGSQITAFYWHGDEIAGSLGKGVVMGAGAGTFTLANINVDDVNVNLNGGNGFELDAGAAGTLSNVNLRLNAYSNTGVGLNVLNAATNWNVTGGAYMFNSTYGIQTSATANNFGITGANLLLNTTGPLNDQATGVIKSIGLNLGIDSAALATIASASPTITLPSDAGAFYISGTTGFINILGGWRGREIVLIKTDAGTLNFGGGGNVPGSYSIVQNAKQRIRFDGSSWY